jgi:hypothetical protein
MSEDFGKGRKKRKRGRKGMKGTHNKESLKPMMVEVMNDIMRNSVRLHHATIRVERDTRPIPGDDGWIETVLTGWKTTTIEIKTFEEPKGDDI